MIDRRKTNREYDKLRRQERIIIVCVESLKQRMINKITYDEEVRILQEYFEKKLGI